MTTTAAFEADDLEPVAPETGGRLHEMVVQLSIIIVAVAFGVAMRTTLGFGLAAALAGSIACYWGLLLVHALMRRGYDMADLSAEVADLADENVELRRLVERRSLRSDEPMGSRAPVVGADRFGVPVGVTRGGFSGDVPKVPAKGPMKGDVPPSLAPSLSPSLAPAAAPRPPAGPPTPRAPGAVDRTSERMSAKPVTAAPEAAPLSKASGSTHGMGKPRPTLGTGEPVVAPRPATPHAGGSASPAQAAPPPLPPLGVSASAAAGERKVAPPPLGVKPAMTPAMAPAATSSKSAPPPPSRQPAYDEVSDDDRIDDAAAEADPRAQDIAMMQSLIKGLADQLNGAGGKAARAATAPADTVADTAEGEALGNVDDQVDALRQAATTMHHPEGHSEVPAPINRDQGALTRIAGAVDAARIDVYLDPILGLDDHRARHYEVSVVLRDDHGELLDPRDFARAIANTGLLPRIDSFAVTEATRLAGQIAARGSNASLFSSLSGESIRDGGFHGALIDALTPDAAIATRLVMAISQSEIRTFGPAHWDALAAMAESGLRYALVDVVDLDVDFEGLKSHGFDFVRLDAQIFLDGLPAPHGVVPSADLCRYLSQLGFALIVGRITDERELVKVFGFGALLGQGRLFGAPRPIKLDRPARTSAA